MRWNIQFVVQGSPVEDDAFWDRLESMSRKRSFYASTLSDLHPSLLSLQLFDIQQCVVGPSHIAFLLEDGRVCRVQYYVSEEYQTKSSTSINETSKESSRKSGERPPKMPRSATSPWIVSAADLSSSASSSLRKWGSHIGVIRSMSSHSSSNSLTTSSPQSRRRGGVPESGIPLNSTSAVRLVRTSQLRGRGLQSSLITGHRVIVPASHVPEELVNQVQGILQGKSRSIIVRELQRTSLDVNLAVNNLLSRDDEDNDDGDDNGNDYMPGEDLLSLLDSGVNPNDHGVFIDADILPEDILGYTLSRTSRSLAGSRSSNRDGSNKDSQERDPIIRLRSPRFLEARRLEADQEDVTHREKPSGKDKESKSGSTLPSIRLAEDIEWWMDGDEHIEFTYIGGMHSELCGVDKNGNLRQWRWKKRYPFHHPSNPHIHHPRTTLLGLESKKITHLASCALRASAATEDGGVCTWIDESVAHHAAVLEQPVTTCVDQDLIMAIGSEKWKKMWNKCLHVSSLYSALLTSSGDIYAWGVLPFHLRKKFLERAQSKIKKSLKNKANIDEIKVGSLVHLNKCAMYQAGAIAINPNGGHPKVGRLLQPVWNLSETCPFKIIKRKVKRRRSSAKELKESSSKGEDHDTQPIYETDGNRERETVVKSTASTTSNPNGSASRKRKYTEVDSTKEKPNKDIQLNLESYTEETQEHWKLQDVFFVEDPQPLPAGKVVKVDGDMVAVLFNKPGKMVGEKMSRKSLLKNMRLLRKEDIRPLAMDAPPKMPECILKKPRKLQIAAGIQINSICATDVGLEAIEGGNNGTPVRFVTIDLSGKVEGDLLPTPSNMFFDEKEKPSSSEYRCSVYHHQQDSARLLLDENSCLYPISRSENSGIRDPRWLNLSPIVALDAGSHMFKKRTSADKDTFKKLNIYAMVFRTQRLMPALLHRNLESVRGILARSTEDNVQEICEERCDGKRNILHVAVSLACPTKNESQSRKTNDDLKPARKDERHSSPSSYREPAPAPNSSQVMPASDRVSAVSAIANAISVVTRTDRNEPRSMRDIMQQFASVLDDAPPSRLRTTSTTSTHAAPTWQSPPLLSDSFRMFHEVAMDTSTSVSSPAAIPTTTWPPDSVPELMHPPVSGVPDSGLNLSTRMSCTPLDIGKQLTDVSVPQTLAPSPPHHFLVPFMKKRGTTADGLLILKELLTCEILKPVLFKLLTQRDALGHTPFMSAVYHRGYPAAIAIFDASVTIAKSCASDSQDGAQANPSTSKKKDCSYQDGYQENLMSMIYPSKSDLDFNPLYLVCVNDTCSFTWTGAQHINQDIYECWTCGLTGTLCCCSECARICHNGHDCKLKRTSPTAYCDCWEKCACRSLIAGDGAARAELLHRLLLDTNLVDLVNSRGETLLQFLATTVARQSVEQRQHRSRGVSRNSSSTKTVLSGRDLTIPQHDLQPPAFCREAFLSLLQDWKCVRSTVLASYDRKLGPTSAPHDSSSVLLPEEELCLYSQTGTSRLDSFILCLIVKCNNMYLDMVLETMINQMQKLDKSQKKDEDQKVVHGLMRSLVRTFIVLSISSGPDYSSSKLAGRSMSVANPLKRIQKAFNALAPVAIRELAEMASALIDPVRLGVAVPMAQFGFLCSNSDIINSCETAFAKPPFHAKNTSAKRKHKSPTKKKKEAAKATTSRSRPYSLPTRRLLTREDSDHGGQQDDDVVDNRRRDADRAVEAQHMGGNMFSVSVIRPDASENALLRQLSVDQEFISTDWENPENNEDDDEQDDNDADHDDNDAENDSFTEAPGNDLTEMDTVAVEDAAESRGRADSAGSLDDVQSEGDLDIDDEDNAQDDGDDNLLNNDDESNMDLTLLTGSDVDTDVGSDFSGDDNDDGDKEDSDSRPPWVFLREVIGSDLNNNNQEEETEDGDDGNDEANNDQFHDSSVSAELPVEDDDENVSSQEEDANNNNQDGDDDDVNSQHDFALERTSNRTTRSTLSSAPQSMRWALGNTGGDSAGRSSSHRRSPSTVYVDPLRMQRNTNSGIGGSTSDTSKQASSFSTATSNAQLARAFGICVREVAKLISATWQGEHGITPLSTFLELNYEDVRDLKSFADQTLSETWKWLITVIDSTEAQLRYGQVLSLAGSPGTVTMPTHGRSLSSLDRPGGVGVFSKSPYSRSSRETDSNNARQDFLQYALSLMRGHTGEHGGHLPVVNVSSMKHIAYVLDALIFYMRQTLPVTDNSTKYKKVKEKSTKKIPPSLNIGYCSTDDDDNDDSGASSTLKEQRDLPDELFSIAVSDVLVGGIIASAQRKVDPAGSYAQSQKSFFRRSESMTFLGCGESDPFSEPLAKTLPLADKPHLLQPNARKEELFGRTRNQLGGIEDESYYDPEIAGIGMGRLKHKMHLKFDKMRQRRTEEKKKKQQEGKEKKDTDVAPENTENKTSVISSTSTVIEQPMEVDSMQVKDTIKKKRFCSFLPPSVDSLLARCRITMELFTKVFLDDVGAEPGSILQELGGFEVREAKFRKDMEKLRNSQTMDLQLNVERDPNRLVLDAFKQLNQHFRRRTGSSSLGGTSQPLMVMRVKVIFKNEPGEGSGVSRSFYTALCEVLLSSDPLPPLDELLVSSDSSSCRRSSGVKKKDQDNESLGRPGSKKVNLRSYFMARYAMQSSPSSGKTSFSSMASAAPPFHKRNQNGGRNEFDGYKRALGERLYPKVDAINSKWPRKITGILLVQPISDLLMLLNNDAMLRASILEASRYLTSINYEVEQDGSDVDEKSSSETGKSTPAPQTASSQPKSSNSSDDKKNANSESDGNDDDVEVDVSTFPLFYQPGKRGFYSPAAGPTPKKPKDCKDNASKNPVGARLNAFRNVGRIIGLCLLQNELCPLPLNRHVLKALLGRKINWYDFAFFDPALFESMRFLLAESENEDSENLFDGLDLSFSADVLYQEGGGQVDLIPNGAEVPVTKHNVLDYVQRYAIYRMITCCHKYIEQMRDGLLDVLPQSSLAGLSAEDFRLLLNGCGRVNVHTLISYTSFNDESGKSAGSSADKLTEFKRWFWSVVSCMNHPARQELLYFWTGSPALPASEDGFQPLPTITIRPPDDQHLPTANTCISRLYVPLYSTRNILKKKLMLAIKTKNFGFV